MVNKGIVLIVSQFLRRHKRLMKGDICRKIKEIVGAERTQAEGGLGGAHSAAGACGGQKARAREGRARDHG